MIEACGILHCHLWFAEPETGSNLRVKIRLRLSPHPPLPGFVKPTQWLPSIVDCGRLSSYIVFGDTPILAGFLWSLLPQQSPIHIYTINYIICMYSIPNFNISPIPDFQQEQKNKPKHHYFISYPHSSPKKCPLIRWWIVISHSDIIPSSISNYNPELNSQLISSSLPADRCWK